MPTGYQIKDQSAAYYVTFQVVYWIDLFTRPAYRDIVLESLRYCQKEKELELFAWVIMSNHVHLLARSSKNDLSGTIRDFKKYTSKAFIELISNSGESRKEWMLRLFAHAAKRQNKAGDYQVWTHENHAVEVYGNSFIQTKVEYIHNNPVRAGIVNKAEDYKYSSACTYADLEGLLDIIPVSLKWKTI
ncbi:MAG: REP-associated tyrosine transposase [Bacteroidales bacterium]